MRNIEAFLSSTSLHRLCIKNLNDTVLEKKDIVKDISIIEIWMRNKSAPMIWQVNANSPWLSLCLYSHTFTLFVMLYEIKKAFVETDAKALKLP